jgi:transcriptional regulator with XRE-family HTH domain
MKFRFGHRIRDLRKENKLTQKELADKVEVSAQVVSNWERNYTDPDSEDIKGLSKVFGVSTDYLLGNTEDRGISLIKKIPEFKAAIIDPSLIEKFNHSDIERFNDYLDGAICSHFEFLLMFTKEDDLNRVRKRLLAVALVSDVSDEIQQFETFNNLDSLERALTKEENNLEFKADLWKELRGALKKLNPSKFRFD